MLSTIVRRTRDRLFLRRRRQIAEDERDMEIARERIEEIKGDPTQLVGGRELEEALKRIVQ
ncbi:MAG: hypothetical protein OXC09_00915 [Truepera sp.]|nr:hypothetical protein [Truepera sp.]